MNREIQVLERKRMACFYPELIVDFFKTLRKQHRKVQVVVEATASYEWFVKLVEPIAQRVVLAHPKKLRVIAESTRKSDKLDAQVLAEFLARDMVPEAFRPSPRQREHRALVRHRQRVQKGITSIKNTLRRILSHYNADIPSLFTQAGRDYLQQVEVSRADRFVLDQLCLQLAHNQDQLKAVDRELSAFEQSGSEQESENRRLLRSIPGVGRVTSDVVVSELGDMQRFSNAKKVVAYAGLAPGQRESAGKRKDLHIEKCGSRLLRATLVEAAWQLVKRSPRWRDIFERLRARTGQKKKAIVAMARRLLTIMFALLKSRRPFQVCLPSR
jgi:transposase